MNEKINETVNETLGEKQVLNEEVYNSNEIINIFREYQENFDLNYQVIRNRLDLILKYRGISLFPEVARAVDKIVQNAIVKIDGKAFDISINKRLTNDAVRNMFVDNFENFLIAQNVNRNIYENFEKWYIDSVLYIWRRKNVETQKYDYYTIDPTQIEMMGNHWVVKIQSAETLSPISMLLQPSTTYTAFNQATLSLEIPLNEIKVYYSGKYHNSLPIGYLHKALKPANQLNLLKDALLVYRLSRSAEKLVFYIDVGDMKKEKADAYVSSIQNKYRTDKYYNASTGEMDTKSMIQSFLKTYFIGRQTNRSTEITTVGGNIQLGDVEDFKLFLNELYWALDVPRTRMGMIGEENSSLPLFNNANEILIMEKDFYKFLQRLRSYFEVIYIDMYFDYLVDNQLASREDLEKYRNFISLKFFNDMEIEKLIKYAELTSLCDMAGKLKDFMGVEKLLLFSTKWVNRELMGFSDRERIQMMIEIKEDIDSSFYGNGKTDPDLTLPPDPQPKIPLGKFDSFMVNKDAKKTEYSKAFNTQPL